jgi:FkbM family methyltransferase
LKPGDVAIDIGAHTGDSTIPIALAVGAAGCVIALEPNPLVFPVLDRNAGLNIDKARIIPLMFAATAESGEFDFGYSDAGFCNGGMHEGISRWRHGHMFKLRVHGHNLQRYLEKQYPDLMNRIRFIKVDTEGHDYRVLASLEGLLVAVKPVLKAEMFALLDGAGRERLFDFVTGLGYDVFITQNDADYPGRRLHRSELCARRHYDVFCVPKS